MLVCKYVSLKKETHKCPIPVFIFWHISLGSTFEQAVKRALTLYVKVHTREAAPPTCPTHTSVEDSSTGRLMCVKYHPWRKRYWQTWLDIWGSELPGYLMHIHLLYPAGLARAPKLCHLATLQLPPKCIVTLIMQICILFPPPPPPPYLH